MYSKIKLFRSLVMVSAALFLTLAAAPASAEKTQFINNTTVTKFRVNGLSAHAFLISDRSQGFVFPTRDEIGNTTALDFGFSTPHPTDPDVSIVFQGSGEIPNSAFTIDATSAHLSLTTPDSDSYQVARCLFNQVTGDLICDFDSDPISFDLTWIANGVGRTFERTKRTEIFGPVTTKYEAEFISRTAIVTGTWAEHSSDSLPGTLMDTQNRTFIREVILKTTP